MSQTTAPSTDLIVRSASTLNDLIAAAERDPAIHAQFNAAFGKPSLSWLVAPVSGVLSVLITRYGLSLSPDTVSAITLVIVGAVGYGWSAISRRFAKANVVAQGAPTP